MAAETGFQIEETLYELPALSSFTMDEAQVLYDYAGLTLEDFALDVDATDDEREESVRKFKNPAVLRALMHIAYQRAHPALKPARVKEQIGAANLFTALAALSGVDEDEEAGESNDPPALTTEPSESSRSDSVGSSESSGSDSTNGSDEQASLPTPIGIGRSDTSSRESPRTTSAV